MLKIHLIKMIQYELGTRQPKFSWKRRRTRNRENMRMWMCGLVVIIVKCDSFLLVDLIVFHFLHITYIYWTQSPSKWHRPYHTQQTKESLCCAFLHLNNSRAACIKICHLFDLKNRIHLNMLGVRAVCVRVRVQDHIYFQYQKQYFFLIRCHFRSFGVYVLVDVVAAAAAVLPMNRYHCRHFSAIVAQIHN